MTAEIIVAILLFLFVLMTFIPTLSGISFMFVVTLVYGFLTDWETLELWHMLVFCGITALSIAVDFFAGILGAKFGGATRTSMLGGMAGMVIGLLVFPPFGAFLGLFVGVFATEMWQMRTQVQALKSAGASVAAAAIGVVINILLAISYFGLFMGFVFF